MLHASARLGNSNTQTKHGLGDRSTSFGYQPPPERTQPARQVYQWLGSLSLSIPLQSPRRDLSNGYLVVEILSHYYPADVSMGSVVNGKGQPCRQSNWDIVQRCCRKHEVELPAKLVADTMAEAHGAACELLEHLYEVLTGKKIQRMPTAAPAGGEGEPPMQPNPALAAQLAMGEPEKKEEAPLIKAAGTGSGSGGPQAPAEFGSVRTQLVGDAMALRKKFAGMA